MYARLVSFELQEGREAVAADLANDLVPQISRQPGCHAVSCFGDGGSRRYFLYVLWASQEEADAAAEVIAPQLAQHLRGNAAAPPDKRLYPVLLSA